LKEVDQKFGQLMEFTKNGRIIQSPISAHLITLPVSLVLWAWLYKLSWSSSILERFLPEASSKNTEIESIL
jgi:hypothetical protein